MPDQQLPIAARHWLALNEEAATGMWPKWQER
jgi:hypothetical protein